MLRRQMKKIIWTILLISVLLTRNSQCSPTSKANTKNATRTAASTKTSTTLVTTAKPATRTTASHSSTRNGAKRTTKRTTTTKPSTTESSISQAVKVHVESTTASTKQNDKKRTTKTTTTTTMSPVELMNKLYQMHGMASSGSSYHTPISHSSHGSSSNMDDIYKQHALALAHAPSVNKKKPEETSKDTYFSGSDSGTTKKPYKSNNLDQIYQQHSSLPSSMHHIMAQHSASSSSSSSAYSSSHSSSSSRPQKTKTKQPHDSSSKNGLSTLMQPLLKQLTPVGAGLSVVLAPLLLFNGFLTFFSNISRFLNNFAQTILPVRRPINGNQGQNPNFPQSVGGPAHLRRQPRDWYENLQYYEDLDILTEQILRAIQAGGQ